MSSGKVSSSSRWAWPKCTWLKMLRNTPKAMCVTPRMTDIFILKELRKLRWFVARLQIGSMPKGYGPRKTPVMLGFRVSMECWDRYSSLQPDWLAMAATLQPEGKIVVARLKHSL